MLGDEGVAGDVGGVQGVALGGGAPGRSASAWDLDDLLTMVKEKVARPAPKLPAPSIAQQRRPGRWPAANSNSSR
jgi:hypothetical protein